MRLGGVAALALVLGLPGCSPDYVTSNSARVNLIVAAINGGAQLDSDVRNGEQSTFICPDIVEVAVAVRNKNPAAPAPSVPDAVVIKSYEVRYFRTDGRATEGVDVPYRITGNLTVAVDVATSGTSTLPIEVVRRQAKLEPPLSTIFQSTVLTTMAEITLYGETISGDAVAGTGRLGVLPVAGTYSIDLTGVTYDAGQLLICAADVANNTTCMTPNPVIKDCDYNLDGISTTMDALLIMRDVVNNVTPTAQQLAHADVGPLVNGGMNPNGGMDMSDALICLKAVTGTPIPGIEIK